MLKNKANLYKQFTHGRILIDIAESVLKCIQPDQLIKKAVQLKRNVLTVQGDAYNLSNYKNIYVVGAGKASYGMAVALHELLGSRITAGYINVPAVPKKKIGSIIVNKASHPYPNASGVRGANNIVELVQTATSDDLVICLMSGGGSSLLPLPIQGITLQEKASLTERLMKRSADIFELNAVRKHISAIKGGRLAEAAAPATVVSLIMSDVLGDALDVIASGPTVMDSSARADALEVLERYKVGSKKIKKIISEHETPKRLDSKQVHNYIVGNNHIALEEISYAAKQHKLNPLLLTSTIRGEAKDVAQVLTSIAQEVYDHNRPVKKPAIIIAGGETTVTVLGNGSGGRNQELVLAAVPLLNKRMTILSLATDGVDGVTPTPVAGAIADGGVAEQCVVDGINYHEYLYSNNSYHCLQQLGCLLYTGPTGTNVGDIIMLLVR